MYYIVTEKWSSAKQWYKYSRTSLQSVINKLTDFPMQIKCK